MEDIEERFAPSVHEDRGMSMGIAWHLYYSTSRHSIRHSAYACMKKID